MNLNQAISFAKLLEASGTSEGAIKGWDTRGRGRHKKDDYEGEKFRGPKGKRAPEPINVNAPLISKTKQQEKALPSVLYKKQLQKQAQGLEEMQQWKEQNKFPHTPESTLKEGDIVKTLKPMKFWDEENMQFQIFPTGSKLTVVAVHPKVGDQEQRITVATRSDKVHDEERIKVSDVELHKSAPTPHIEVMPVPKSQIKLQYKSSDGATVTVIKTPEMKDYDPKTVQELAKTPSHFKGQFQLIEKVVGDDGRVTRYYDTSKVPSVQWSAQGPGTAAPSSGATVFVDRYKDKVKVEEWPYQTMGFVGKAPLRWTYKIDKFPYVTPVLGMLKQRYGITIPAKEKFGTETSHTEESVKSILKKMKRG